MSAAAVGRDGAATDDASGGNTPNPSTTAGVAAAGIAATGGAGTSGPAATSDTLVPLSLVKGILGEFKEELKAAMKPPYEDYEAKATKVSAFLRSMSRLTEHDASAATGEPLGIGGGYNPREDVLSRLRQLCLPADKPALCPPVLVEGARQWLVPCDHVNRTPLEPTLFLSWAPFVTYKEGGTGVVDDLKLCGAGCVGGAFMVDGVGRFGFPCLGSLIACHEYMSERDCYGMYAWWPHFTLYHSITGLPATMIKGNATAPGTAALVQDFFAKVQDPPLLTHLRALLSALGTDIMHVGGRCHLGSGAWGHVFTVRGDAAVPGSTPRALKVVVFSARAGDDDDEHAGMKHQAELLKDEFIALGTVDLERSVSWEIVAAGWRIIFFPQQWQLPGARIS